MRLSPDNFGDVGEERGRALAELRQGRLGHGPPRSGAKNKFYTTAAHSADEHHTEKASSRLVRVRLTAMQAQGSTSTAVSYSHSTVELESTSATGCRDAGRGPPATGAPHTSVSHGRPANRHTCIQPPHATTQR